MSTKRTKEMKKCNISPSNSSTSSLSESPSAIARKDALYSSGSGIGKFRRSKSASIFKMIEAEDWSKVREFIITPQGRKSCLSSDTSGLSVLGMSLGFHAPLDIVIRLLEIDPSASLKEDMFHAVPLHLACLNGADVKIINYLLANDDRASAYCADDDKRVALHHAVEYACKSTEDDSNESMECESDGIDVITSLVGAAPRMIYKIDAHGDTPIDMTQMLKYHINNENHPRYQKADTVYKILTKHSILYYRKEKKRWEEQIERERSARNSNESKDECTKVQDSKETASMTLSRVESQMGKLSISDSGSTPNFSSATENKNKNKKRKKFLGGLFSRKTKQNIKTSYGS